MIEVEEGDIVMSGSSPSVDVSSHGLPEVAWFLQTISVLRERAKPNPKVKTNIPATFRPRIDEHETI